MTARIWVHLTYNIADWHWQRRDFPRKILKYKDNSWRFFLLHYYVFWNYILTITAMEVYSFNLVGQILSFIVKQQKRGPLSFREFDPSFQDFYFLNIAYCLRCADGQGQRWYASRKYDLIPKPDERTVWYTVGLAWAIEQKMLEQGVIVFLTV